MSEDKIWVVVPNWNGAELLPKCLDSLISQTIEAKIVVVDNGSVDDSLKVIKGYEKVHLIEHPKNLGFTGGVNAGIKYALSNNADAIALFNTDAIADKNWLKSLFQSMKNNQRIGITTGKIIDPRTNKIDNTGEDFSNWGLPFSRNRNSEEKDVNKSRYVFGASGGSTLYRSEMLREIGLFDNDFFAYYEDADINLRARLRGWEAWYEASARVSHSTGSTSSRVKGFTTYQTIKNLPWIIVKDLPLRTFAKTAPKFFLIYSLIFFKAFLSRNFYYALKGLVVSLAFLPKKIYQRISIQKTRTVSSKTLEKAFYKGLPPESSLNKLLQFFR